MIITVRPAGKREEHERCRTRRSTWPRSRVRRRYLPRDGRRTRHDARRVQRVRGGGPPDRPRFGPSTPRIATTRDDLVLESRLAGWLSADHADFRFWFDAPVSTRARAHRRTEEKPVDRAKAETERREASEKKRGTASTTTSTSATSRSTTPRTTPPDGDRAVHRRPRRDHRRVRPRDRRGKAPIEGVSYDF